ncbi:hypothetical protein DH2020_002461 [Rehmannia glutinosa]|uniref:K Homology domain-containing protein n=1 Tax=Rehmannia glutinosa TaxID=99300 RepID=A0ABR0XUD4_REHGL
MSQAQTPVNPSPNPNPGPNENRTPSSIPNPPPASEAHLNPASAVPSAKAAIAADNPGPSDDATATLKRPREEDTPEGEEAGTTTDVPAAKRRVAATHDLIYRIVVPSRQIGKVIGKSGHRIQKIREDTKATIKIADAISVSKLISSSLVFFRFSLTDRGTRSLIKPGFRPSLVPAPVLSLHSLTCPFPSLPPPLPLLVSVCVCVLSGEDGGVDMWPGPSLDQLAILASPPAPVRPTEKKRHEERVIIISSKDSGNIFSDAENALHQIVSLILKDDDGSVEALKVGAGHVAANTVRLLIVGSQAGGLIGVSGQNIVNLRNTSGATIAVLSPNQLPPCASAHESDRVVQISGEVPAVLRAVVEIGCQLRTTNLAADYVTLDLMVPENLVGGLIGRFGANISRIRNESGANIKVYGGRGEQTQRQIHLSGNTQQVALAKQRVDEYVYAELLRQAGGQLQQTAGQFQQFPTQQPMPDISNTLYQGYGHAHAHAHALYATSNQEAGMMAALPQLHASTAPNPAPPYYGHHSYPAPQL